MTGFWDRLLPEHMEAGEFSGESLFGELLRRASWHLLPEAMLTRWWNWVLLGQDGIWCFIIGANNSGTSLLHDLLARH